MSMTEQLEKYGVDVSEGLERCMGNAALYERLLKKLPADVKNKKVIELVDAGDYAAAYENAHALKGTTGNLSVTPLYTAYSEACRLFKDNDPQGAKAVIENILECQDKIVSCIENE